MSGRARPGSLVDRAFRRLETGPTSTEDLAADVLSLRGHPGAAGKAVLALLGGDSRFEVDPQGMWRLAPGAVPVGTPLRDLRFAVVDVETTGGPFSRGHRITEVAVVEVRSGRVEESWHTLVHPGRPVPP
ncbi:MAG: hypothetical protein KC645_15925, partial [Gemmatimonadetes bacterium]|nr:hypothetical protein [Gemmatimonadota bacterium]